MHQIGVQTGDILDTLGIDEGFALIAHSGFTCVDFNLDHLLAYADITSGRASRGQTDTLYDQGLDALLRHLEPYARSAQRHGIAFAQAHAPFPSYVQGDEQTNAYMVHVLNLTLAVCGQMGIPALIVHPPIAPYESTLSPDELWGLVRDLYVPLIPAAKEHNVTICLENMFTGHNHKVYASTCSDFHAAARYIDELNALAGADVFAFCLDVGHALLTGSDIYAAVGALGERIATLHLHDNDGMGDNHLAPYMGLLDWKRLCLALKDFHYKGELSFETFNALRVTDVALMPQMLAYIAAAGRLFAQWIQP